MKIQVQRQAKKDHSLLIFACGGASLKTDESLDEGTVSVLNQALAVAAEDKTLGDYRQIYASGKRMHICVLPTKEAFEYIHFERIMARVRAQLSVSRDRALNVLVTDDFKVQKTHWQTLRMQMVIHLAEVAYEFSEFKAASAPRLESVIMVEDLDKQSLIKDTAVLQSLVDGMKLTKDLGNMPPNVCTPQYLAQQARSLSKQYRQLKCKVLGKEELKKKHMNAYLAVAGGSANPPQFILMEYKGAAAKQKPFVLLGKGITFDTGGISLKPAAEMDEMKYDMGGAAAVFGVMRAICALKLPINVVGAVAAAENMPGSNAYRPGDILRSMSGQTIEVLNTDAEGRLVLADALTYLKGYKPAVVIDMATLTGACIIALGYLRSGFFANDDDLAEQILSASEKSRDLIWKMPLDAEYMETMRSNFADIANIGGRREAGTITAAGFLERFVSDYSWAHLDIAGTAWHSGKRKGSTGRPVPLLLQFLMDRARGA